MVFNNIFYIPSQLTTNFHWSCYRIFYICVIIHFPNSMWSFGVEANLCRFFYRLFICLCSWRSKYQEGVGIPLTGLTLPHFCACPKSGPEFPTSYVMVCFYVQWFDARGDCSFCWNEWSFWPQLFKLYFHNFRKKWQGDNDLNYLQHANTICFVSDFLSE